MVVFLFKVLVWKTILGIGFLSFIPLSSAPLENRLANQAGEQRGGDLGAAPSLPLAQNRRANFPRRKTDTEFDVKLSARNFLILDEASELPLFAQEADTRRPIGSITKLLTALVFLRHEPLWDKEVVIEAGDGREGRLFFNEGDRVRVYDLFFATLTGSSNNAAMALARSTGLTLTDFVREMNQEAARLGLKNTRVVEPTGLNPQNQSTAREVALLLKAALAEPLIKKATTTRFYVFNVIDAWGDVIKKNVSSTNLLLGSDLTKNGIVKIEGGKTGFIDEAGHSMSVEVKNQAGHKLLVVVLGASSNSERFSEAVALADWAYSSYLWPGESDAAVSAVSEN